MSLVAALRQQATSLPAAQFQALYNAIDTIRAAVNQAGDMGSLALLYVEAERRNNIETARRIQAALVEQLEGQVRDLERQVEEMQGKVAA
jgi:hypothetical protein